MCFSSIFLLATEIKPPNITFCLLSSKTVRSFRSYPTHHPAGPGQSDIISRCDGAAALPFSRGCLCQDLVGEGWREASGKYTSADLDGERHVANYRSEGVCALVSVRAGSVYWRGLEKDEKDESQWRLDVKRKTNRKLEKLWKIIGSLTSHRLLQNFISFPSEIPFSPV